MQNQRVYAEEGAEPPPQKPPPQTWTYTPKYVKRPENCLKNQNI